MDIYAYRRELADKLAMVDLVIRGMENASGLSGPSLPAGNGPVGLAEPVGPVGPVKRVYRMSDAGRARISAAARERWAKLREAANASRRKK